MKRALQGHYETISTIGEVVNAFVPAPLPPVPELRLAGKLQALHAQALLALGRLDQAAQALPDRALLLYMYVRKEAVLSSMIEGTQSSLSDLLLFELDELPGVPLDDVQEVSRYVAAMEHGMRRLREGFPLSLRLLRELHAVLLTKGRGSEQAPGEFRRSQNWIGGTRPGNAAFVPPPAHHVVACLGDLEKFLHDDRQPLTTLVKAALAHVQFETIHPFLDGNGRVGRLLITLYLCAEKLLREPLLYLSLHFKTHRATYYDLLTRVRRHGEWEAWLEFFLEAVIDTAGEAVGTIGQLAARVAEDRARVATLGRARGSADTVLTALQRRPIATVAWLAEATQLTPATVGKALMHLQALGIVSERTGQRRNRLFDYGGYIRVLEAGMQAQ